MQQRKLPKIISPMLEIKDEVPYSFSEGDYYLQLLTQKVILNVKENSTVNLRFDLGFEVYNAYDFEVNVGENSTLNLMILNSSEYEKSLIFKGKACKSSLFFIKTADVSFKNSAYFIDIDLEENSSSSFEFSALSTNESLKRFDVSFNHLGKNTKSNYSGFGVCEGASKISCVGKSHIYENSIKSEANQKIKIILFDEESKAIAQPILKIDCDDIKASHGCAIGAINQEHLYYLLSRGIKEKEAKKLIVYGYLLPIAKYFTDDDEEIIKERIYERV